MKHILWSCLLALVFVLPVQAQDARLDLEGTPMLLSTGTNNLTVGTATSGALKLHIGAGGSLQLVYSNPDAGTAAADIDTAGTIDTTEPWQRVTNDGAATGVILEAGTVHGQLVLVSQDKDATSTITLAAEATSNACAGVTVVMAAGESVLFVWDATDTCWAGLVTP